MNYNIQQLTYSIDHPISVTIVQYKNEPPMIVIIASDKRIVVKDSLILQYDKP